MEPEIEEIQREIQKLLAERFWPGDWSVFATAVATALAKEAPGRCLFGVSGIASQLVSRMTTDDLEVIAAAQHVPYPREGTT